MTCDHDPQQRDEVMLSVGAFPDYDDDRALEDRQWSIPKEGPFSISALALLLVTSVALLTRLACCVFIVSSRFPVFPVL